MSMQMRKKQKGQGMVEYIVIVALIGLGAIAAFSFFGQAVRGQTGQMAEQVAGQNTTNGLTQSQNGATGADTAATDKVNLNTYQAEDNQ